VLARNRQIARCTKTKKTCQQTVCFSLKTPRVRSVNN